MALSPGATMAVTGVYANMPRETCKAWFSQFAHVETILRGENQPHLES
jgi:hypothetical protein